jgi:hypothetical protein
MTILADAPAPVLQSVISRIDAVEPDNADDARAVAELLARGGWNRSGSDLYDLSLLISRLPGF